MARVRTTTRVLIMSAAALLGLASCGGGDGAGGSDGGGNTGDGGSVGAPRYFGAAHSGNFWLGPVDYTETQWHNACAPTNKYPAQIRTLYGDHIMGLAN